MIVVIFNQCSVLVSIPLCLMWLSVFDCLWFVVITQVL